MTVLEWLQFYYFTEWHAWWDNVQCTAYKVFPSYFCWLPYSNFVKERWLDWSQEKWSFMAQQTPATAQAIPEVHGVLSHETLPSYFLVLTNAKDWLFALRSKFKRGNHWTSVFQYRRTTLVQSTTGRWGSKNMSSCSQNLKRTWPFRSIHVLISHSRNLT